MFEQSLSTRPCLAYAVSQGDSRRGDVDYYAMIGWARDTYRTQPISSSWSAGVRRELVCEVPSVLNDARAVVLVAAAGATAVVALDCPYRQRADAVGLCEGEQLRSVGEVGHLGLLWKVVDAGQDCVSFHSPQLSRCLCRIQAGELGMQTLGRANRGRPHLGGD